MSQSVSGLDGCRDYLAPQVNAWRQFRSDNKADDNRGGQTGAEQELRQTR